MPVLKTDCLVGCEPMHEQIKNILLLSVEDLNDWIGPLGGHPDAYTPNLDRLAARGMVFQNAFTPAPACSPARTAALFGQSPWRTGIYGNEQSWAMAFEPGRQSSIVGQARAAGWRTTGAGKVFHLGKSGLDMADWDAFLHEPQDSYFIKSKAARQGLISRGDDFGKLNQPKLTVQDIRACNRMLSEIQPGANRQFWAHGVFRPHLPFIVPNRFFGLIPGEVRLPPSFGNRFFDPGDESELAELPAHARAMAQREMGRALARTGEYSDFLRAYLASIAFADMVVGRILDRLEQTGLAQTTLIVFWSDHGWQLGEKLAFKKFSLWERALRVPLLLAGPGVPVGRSTEPVSLIDIYPTLLEVLGGAPPHALDGQSLWPLLAGAHGRGFAVSAFNRPSFNEQDRVSVTIRSRDWRLIRYYDGTGELYDHRKDPYERQNLLRADRLVSEQALPASVSKLMSELPSLAPALREKDLPDKLDTLYQANRR